MKIRQLFLVRNSTLTYPVFYVEANDILEATQKAKMLIAEINNERVISSVSAVVDIPLLDLVDRKGD